MGRVGRSGTPELSVCLMRPFVGAMDVRGV